MNSRQLLPRAITTAVFLLLLAASAQAGPPLICHPFDIGPAKSLPMVDWNRISASNYDLKNLARDTVAILDSGAPALVQMETLRRAAIYARQDPQAARELLTRLQARAANSDAAGHPDALAWFDVGYLVETYKQWMGGGDANPAAGLDGYGWVKKAIGLRGEDPEMELAAALITLPAGPESDYRDHARRAMAGAKTDPLLARNLTSNFHNQTIAELLAGGAEGGMGR